MNTTAQDILSPDRTSRRAYNGFVNNPVLEDYSLRYAPRSFRRWSEYAVAVSALGGIAYLADQAIGGSITISYGFTNAFWAIIVSAVIIFLTGLPIAYYSAKYNIDMDLLTRGAGFGYLGSTLTSLIYASFTFIFFALEGSIMAQAFQMYFHIPLPWGYLLASLLVIPLVVFGMTALSKLQTMTQPLWAVLIVAPLVAVLLKDPTAMSGWTSFSGHSLSGSKFDPLLFGTAAGVVLSLIAQIGEQVDYIRFMPDKTAANAKRWWLAVVLAGPGWVILGAAKQLMGSFYTSVAVANGTPMGKANEPIEMYVHGFESVFAHHAWVALTVATFFVVLSQIKINVTNAYSGSLSWSNFFSRVLHSHPGRVVWIFLNVGISLSLMEMGVFATLLKVLGFYSNVAIAWIGAVVADLVINKPLLKLSPSYIEFKRAHLYNFNPVGFGAMAIASAVSIAAFFGLFGPAAQAYSTFIALGLAFVLSPILALITRGRWYIARDPHYHAGTHHDVVDCAVCGYEYEKEDMACCPHHDGPICSLCCSLETGCGDKCKEVTVSLGATPARCELPAA